jgi:putative FmdB family regulatory protein
MPLYEYRCEACGHQFEVIQKFSDEPIAVCPKCSSGPVAKLLSSPAFQFKGTGWYITDYARKGATEGKEAKGTPATESKDDSKKDDSKKDDSKSTTTSSTDSSATATPSASKPTST